MSEIDNLKQRILKLERSIGLLSSKLTLGLSQFSLLRTIGYYMERFLIGVGRSGGQTLTGGTGAGDDLRFETTANVLKGDYIFSEMTTGGFLKNTALGVVTGGNSEDTGIFIKADGSRVLTGDWDIGVGRKISTEQIMARSNLGLKLYEDGGKGIFVQDSTGYVGVGTASPGAKLDVVGMYGSCLDLKLGGGVVTPGSRADNTDKVSLFGSVHYDIDANPCGLICSISTNTYNNMYLGGGSGYLNAATYISFYTGSTTKTATGTSRLVIDSTGKIGIATTSPTAILDINSDILRLRTAKTPESAGATGNAGDSCWDTNWEYRATATNTWTRTPHLGFSDYPVIAASATKTTAAAPYTNDGYVEMVINGTTVKVMTTA